MPEKHTVCVCHCLFCTCLALSSFCFQDPFTLSYFIIFWSFIGMSILHLRFEQTYMVLLNTVMFFFAICRLQPLKPVIALTLTQWGVETTWSLRNWGMQHAIFAFLVPTRLLLCNSVLLVILCLLALCSQGFLMTCLMQILCLQYKKGDLSSTSQLHGFLSLTMSVTTILHLSGFRWFLNYATQSTLSRTAAPVEEMIQSQHINKQ